MAEQNGPASPAGGRVGSDPAARVVFMAGVVSVACYAIVLGLSFDFKYGEGHADRPIPAVLTAFAVAFATYLVVAYRLFSSPLAEAASPPRLRTVVGFAVVFRLLLLPSVPIQEIDYYRYLWDGQVTAAGHNPFRHSPADVEQLGPAASPGSELSALWDLANRSEAARSVFERVHHREVPTIYPPASQWVFASTALLAPPDASLETRTFVLKLHLLAFDLGTLSVVIALLRRLRLPTSWCVGYAWCPLLMKEVSNSAHLDAIAVFFTTAALYSFTLVAGRSWRRGVLPAVAGAGLLGLGVLAKSYPLVILPAVAAHLFTRLRGRAVLPLLVCVAVIAGGYAPYLSTRGETGHTPVSGLGTFLGRWEMNDFLFMIAHEHLRPASAGGADRWFVVTPDAVRESCVRQVRAVMEELGLGLTERRAAFLLTQGLMGSLLAVVVGWLAVRQYRRPTHSGLLRAAFLTLGWAWLLTSAANPWYLLWGLPLLAFARRRAWWLLPGLAFVYYLRFWLEYRAADTDEALRANRDLFDFGLVWLEYIPFFIALVAESVWLRTRGRRHFG